MLRTSYFDDGYTTPGFVAPVARLHRGLRFTFRPALIEERSQLNDAARQLAGPLYDRHVAAFAADKLVTWELMDREQQPVPIATASLLRLHPDVFVKLSRIVLGWTASDVDPTWTAETHERVEDEALAAALTGHSIGEAREEQDVKN
jgi:hypothetical protein